MNGPLHPSLPRRPVRTSQAPEPRGRDRERPSTEFSRVALPPKDRKQDRVERVIAGIYGRRGPMLTLHRERRHEGRTERFSGLYIMPTEEAAIVRAAIDLANMPRFKGRYHVGSFPTGEGLEIRVSANLTQFGPAVFIERVATASNARIGGTPIDKAWGEIDAMDRALVWLAAAEEDWRAGR